MIKQFITLTVIFVSLLTMEVGRAALADPTKPANYEVKPTGGVSIPGVPAQAVLELKAIIISKDQKLAIINGQLLRVGEKIQDKQVVKIEQDGVELLGPTGGSTKLMIIGQPIKQPR